MGQKLSPLERALYRAVDEVLHYVWDPIGVAGVPEARDEYHSYLPVVFGMVRDGNGEEEIAQYLSQVATERMGLSRNADHDLEVARVLVAWKDAIAGQI